MQVKLENIKPTGVTALGLSSIHIQIAFEMAMQGDRDSLRLLQELRAEGSREAADALAELNRIDAHKVGCVWSV